MKHFKVSTNFDILGISESWLNDTISNKDVQIHGFSPDPLRADCSQTNDHPRGGVCVYFKDHIPIVQRKDLQIINECVIAEIKISNNKNIFLLFIYRSPNQSREELQFFVTKLTDIITLIKNENPSLIALTGDFNARSPLLWSGESCENLAGKLLSDFTTLNGFEQLIDEPTHFPMGNIETCIDLILSNNETAFSDIGVLPSLDTHCNTSNCFW